MKLKVSVQEAVAEAVPSLITDDEEITDMSGDGSGMDDIQYSSSISEILDDEGSNEETGMKMFNTKLIISCTLICNRSGTICIFWRHQD